jgi:hypothetical protein
MGSATTSPDPICHLCNQPVPIEAARTDENGNAVHEGCYVAQITRASSARRLRVLAWISTVPATAVCSVCGDLFRVPVGEMTRSMATASLQNQFDDHTCKATAG